MPKNGTALIPLASEIRASQGESPVLKQHRQARV